MVESFPLLFSVLFSIASWMASLSAGDWWSYGAAFVVFVGVVGETIAELTDLVKTKSWARKFEVASALVLILGLAGDIVSIHLTRIEEANLTRQAGDAKQSAFDAKTAAIQARQEADGAKSTADSADTLAKSADALSSKAESASGKAESLASDAHREADSASKELGTLRTATQSLESEAKKTEADLMNVAVCTAPRVIDSWFVGPTSYVDTLRPMAGQAVFIEVMPDAESRRAALSLANALATAKWNIQSPIKQVDGLKDGVSVEPSDSAFDPQGWGAWRHAQDVSDALVDFLHSHNWQAKRDWWLDSKGMTEHDPKIAPFGSIRIQIGLYPATEYLSPPADKQLVATLEERKREADALEAKDWESRVAGLSPAERELMERRRNEWEAQTQILTNRYTRTGPCQDLFSKYF